MISAPTPWLKRPLKPGAVSSSAYRSRAGPPICLVPSGAEEPSGLADMISTPPATTRSAWPEITAAAAVETACWDDPHCRSMVKPGTDSGQPAPSTAMRPMFPDCMPTDCTVPQCTSSTRLGSMPVRSARVRRTWADSSTA